jgi:protein SCO1/2
VRLYSDLIRGRVVVIDSFFADCTGICPVLAKNLRAVQDALGERLGRDAFVLSVTVDPANDSPERLREYAKTCGAKPGWSFLSGDPANVAAALGKLGFAVPARENHSNVILVGNDRTGLWKKAHGLAEAAEIVAIVDSVLEDQGP